MILELIPEWSNECIPGWIPEGTNIMEFENAIRSVCEPIFEKPLSEISFGQVLLSLLKEAKRFDMEVQPQLILLQKIKPSPKFCELGTALFHE